MVYLLLIFFIIYFIYLFCFVFLLPNQQLYSECLHSSLDSPKSTLTVTPESPVFSEETVNLTCVIESHSDWRYDWTYDWRYDWTYEWYKGSKDSIMLNTSDHYTVNRDTLTIRGATESDQDQYWCRGQRDERPKSSHLSSAVNLTVIGKLNIIVLLNSLSNQCLGEVVYAHTHTHIYIYIYILVLSID